MTDTTEDGKDETVNSAAAALSDGMAKKVRSLRKLNLGILLGATVSLLVFALTIDTSNLDPLREPLLILIPACFSVSLLMSGLAELLQGKPVSDFVMAPKHIRAQIGTASLKTYNDKVLRGGRRLALSSRLSKWASVFFLIGFITALLLVEDALRSEIRETKSTSQSDATLSLETHQEND